MSDARLKVDPFAIAIVGLLYVEHLLFGADRIDLRLLFAVLHLLIGVGLAVFARGERLPPLPLGLPAALLGVVFAIGLFSLAPVGPPLAHPLWSYVPGSPASISLDPEETRVQLIKLAGFVSLFLVGASMGARRQSAERLAAYIVYAGILYCAWAFFAWVTMLRPYGGDRLTASFVSSNTAGSLFAALCVMSVVALLRPFAGAGRAGGRLRLEDVLPLWPQGLLLLLALSCLLLTQSRGALMSFVAGALLSIGCLAWIKSSQRSLTGGFIAVVSFLLFVGMVFVVVGGDHTTTRLSQTDPLNNDRLQLYAAYWPTAMKSPWLGYGLGAFQAANFLSLNRQNGVLISYLGSAHSVYLQWLLQMGFPGALAMFGCVAAILVATVRGAARRSSQQTLAISSVGAAVVFAVHGLVDFSLEIQSIAAFFALILGLGYGIVERPAGEGRRSSKRK